MYKCEKHGRANMYAKMVADSIDEKGNRLCSLELRYPRFILAEVNTHRIISKSSASSRAIPINKIIDQLNNEPAQPVHWGENQSGMQAGGDGVEKPAYIAAWRRGASEAVELAKTMRDLNLHKQIANRVMEPYAYATTIVTATEWDNFFALRLHKDAQPEFQHLASLMMACMEDSKATLLHPGEWHLPYVALDEIRAPSGEMRLYDWALGAELSAARSARVSYLNHDSTRPSLADDQDLFQMLWVRPCRVKDKLFSEDDPRHASALEHQGTPMADCLSGSCEVKSIPWPKGSTHLDRNLDFWSANFKNWAQFRQVA